MYLIDFVFYCFYFLVSCFLFVCFHLFLFNVMFILFIGFFFFIFSFSFIVLTGSRLQCFLSAQASV